MITIETGDCRDLVQKIPDGSVDLIFTDPPYLKEFLPLYEWLARDASKKVKPEGFIAAYVGCYWLSEVMKLMSPHLDYFMELVIVGNGFGSMMWNRRVIGKHKSVLLFTPKGGDGMPRCNITSVFVGTGQDKRYHVWGQDESSARYYIDCLTKPGDMVYDPFCGGGTTPAMCKILGRDCISHEITPATAEIARTRVAVQQMPFSQGILSNENFELEVEK